MQALTKVTKSNVGAYWRQCSGIYVRDLRDEAGMTQAELAFMVGLPNVQSISNIESGRGFIPNTRIYDFAAALAVEERAFCMAVMRWASPFLFGGIFGKTTDLQHELQLAMADTAAMTPRRPRSPMDR